MFCPSCTGPGYGLTANASCRTHERPPVDSLEHPEPLPSILGLGPEHTQLTQTMAGSEYKISIQNKWKTLYGILSKVKPSNYNVLADEVVYAKQVLLYSDKLYYGCTYPVSIKGELLTPLTCTVCP